MSIRIYWDRHGLLQNLCIGDKGIFMKHKTNIIIPATIFYLLLCGLVLTVDGIKSGTYFKVILGLTSVGYIFAMVRLARPLKGPPH